MKKLRLLLTALFLTACSSVDSLHPFDNEQAAKLLQQHMNTVPTKEKIALPLPNKRSWQKIDLSEGTLGTPLMLIPADETRENWTRSFQTRISGYMRHPNITVDQFAQQQINEAKEYCHSASGHIIHLSKDDCTYQLEISGCPYDKDQIQFGKAMKGSDAIYLVYFTATPAGVSNAEFEKMSGVINRARLVPRR